MNYFWRDHREMWWVIGVSVAAIALVALLAYVLG
jgi:hypothetical protein